MFPQQCFPRWANTGTLICHNAFSFAQGLTIGDDKVKILFFIHFGSLNVVLLSLHDTLVQFEIRLISIKAVCVDFFELRRVSNSQWPAIRVLFNRFFSITGLRNLMILWDIKYINLYVCHVGTYIRYSITFWEHPV